MKKFIIHWVNGTTEEITGTDISNAFMLAGYGGGALQAVGYWEESNERFDIMTALQCVDDAPTADLTPCDVCKYNPPSSGDGKPCLLCPACKY